MVRLDGTTAAPDVTLSERKRSSDPGLSRQGKAHTATLPRHPYLKQIHLKYLLAWLLSVFLCDVERQAAC